MPRNEGVPGPRPRMRAAEADSGAGSRTPGQRRWPMPRCSLIRIGRESWCLPYAGYFLVTRDIWQVKPDTWQMTHDTLHVTHDRWGEVNLLSTLQLPSSYGLEVKVFWRFGGKSWLTYLINQLITYGGVCRKAPATPGLLKNLKPWLGLNRLVEYIQDIKRKTLWEKCSEIW